MKPIGLKDAIQQLRRELIAAVREGKGSRLPFELEAIDLELQVEVKREAGAEGGLKFLVPSVGVKGTVAKSRTHTVRLRLKPRPVGGGLTTIVDSGDERGDRA